MANAKKKSSRFDENGLTVSQARFVSAYVKNGGNATLAYKTAGYKSKSDNTAAVSASKLLRKDKVLRAIEAKRKKLNDRLELEEDFELKEAIRLFKMCSQPKQAVNFRGEPVTDDDGKFVLAFDSKGANMALQTICKIRGKFVEKKQVDLTVNERSDWLADALKEINDE